MMMYLFIETKMFAKLQPRLRCLPTNDVSIGLADISVYETAETDGTFKPSNPFHEDPKTENSLLDIALENLQIITCRKGPSA